MDTLLGTALLKGGLADPNTTLSSICFTVPNLAILRQTIRE